jgi:hypothetical protein
MGFFKWLHNLIFGRTEEPGTFEAYNQILFDSTQTNDESPYYYDEPNGPDD